MSASIELALVERRPEQRRAFVICTAPRSGSYLLAEALEGTGCLGVPREYFDEHPNKAKWWIDRLGIARDQDYIDKVIAAGSTANGVFGLKLLWPQASDLVNRFKRVPGVQLPAVANPTFVDCLRTRFGSLSYLWLRRRNKVAQGISLYRAFKTAVWHVRPDAVSADPNGPDIAFDFEEIDHRVQQVTEYDERWHRFFVERRMKALVVIYEEFVKSKQSYDRTVREVCRYLGADPDRIPIRAPAFRQQSDQLSAEWEKEYRRQKQERLARAAGRPIASVMPRRAQRRAPADAAKKPGHARTKPPLTPTAAPTEPAAPPSTVLAALNPGQLIAYDLNPATGVKIAAGSQRRAWMDATHHRYAYRCLPLVIANQYGWLLLAPMRIQAVWNGAESLDAISIEYPPGEERRIASSHFGAGILTFSVNFVFRTPPGVNLHVRGPANMPKDGIYALEGIVETDWSEATFTMNWKFTRAGQPVVFEQDEPFAMLTPIARGSLEGFHPEIHSIGDDPALAAGYRAWADSRLDFNTQLKVKDSAAQKKGWQRHYIRGETVSRRKANEHQTTVAVRDFLDKRK